jgi:hypothetical protein
MCFSCTQWFLQDSFDLNLRFFSSLYYDFQIRSVAAPELCVDTENKKADERFGLKSCVKDDGRSTGEQVCAPLVFLVYNSLACL